MASTKMVRLMTTWEMASIALSPGQGEVEEIGARRSVELADFLDLVAGVQQHDLGLVARHLALVHRGVGADDEQVAHGGLTGRRAIQRDRARAARRLDDVSGKALAVVDVVELDVLELLHVGGVHQVLDRKSTRLNSSHSQI